MNQESSSPYSSVEKMNTAGNLFIISGIITFFFNTLSLFLYLPVLQIISGIVFVVSFVVLILSMDSLTVLVPFVAEDVKKTTKTLIVFLVIEFCTIFFVLATFKVMIVIVGMASLALRVLSFTFLNNTFKRLGQEMESIMFQIYAWFGIIAFIALIVTAFTLNVNLIIAVGLIVLIGGNAITIGVGTKLRFNAQKIAELQTTSIAESVGQSDGQQVKVSQTQKPSAPSDSYCFNCGAIIKEADMNFCSNCGASLKPAK